MIFRWPGHIPAGRRVRGAATLADIVPTLLEVMGCGDVLDKMHFDGRSMWALERGERAANYPYLFITECTWMRKHGMRTPEWKLIEALEPDFHGIAKRELYNLIDDPAESVNLAETEKDTYRALRGRMVAHIERRTAETGRPDPILRWKLGTKLYIGSVAVAKKLQERKD
jgi:arylsulfatase A-like enzyme